MSESKSPKVSFPGTTAHQATLRRLLAESEAKALEAANVPELNEEQREAVSALVDQVLNEPCITPAAVIELLESLLADPSLSPATIYEALEDRQTIILYRVAGRAFLLGRAASSGGFQQG